MEVVIFNYYSYKPRIRIFLRLKLHTVPVVGDFIFVPSSAFSQVSKKMKNRDLLLDLGAEFVVTKRTKNLVTALGEDWRIDIDPVVKFIEIE